MQGCAVLDGGYWLSKTGTKQGLPLQAHICTANGNATFRKCCQSNSQYIAELQVLVNSAAQVPAWILVVGVSGMM
jgi:hypothetical protein